MVGEQVQTGRGLVLDGWKTRSEWMGARPVIVNYQFYYNLASAQFSKKHA